MPRISLRVHVTPLIIPNEFYGTVSASEYVITVNAPLTELAAIISHPAVLDRRSMYSREYDELPALAHDMLALASDTGYAYILRLYGYANVNHRMSRFTIRLTAEAIMAGQIEEVTRRVRHLMSVHVPHATIVPIGRYAFWRQCQR